jgi:hypothetical protein
MLSDSKQFYPLHLAIPVKAYFGRQKKGRLLVRTGIHYFPTPSERLTPGVQNAYLTFVPRGFGYRKNIQNWYIEGSFGAALTSGVVVFTDPNLSSSKVTNQEIYYGLEVGRQNVHSISLF